MNGLLIPDVKRQTRAVRRERDFYETAPWMTRALLRYVRVRGTVLEPCVGDHSIARELNGCSLVTNDIDPARDADYHLDAAVDELWRRVDVVDWVITNPPYVAPLPMNILKRALTHANGVALMLRISWLEPAQLHEQRQHGQCDHGVVHLDARITSGQTD